MDFWNTVLGNRLAETLIRYLPKIAKQKKIQTSQWTPCCDIDSTIKEMCEEGWLVVSMVSTNHDGAVIVFEKEE